ncbi:hypothetical protein TNCV_1022691 [Trichonephila clavipes]|nr:hypothetical protein TNCV_1022691 [Trichonephila clavipes]
MSMPDSYLVTDIAETESGLIGKLDPGLFHHVTTLSIISLPVCNFKIRAKCHFKVSEFSEGLTNTKSPYLKPTLSLHHLGLCCNRFKCSEDHLNQKCWFINCIKCLHLICPWRFQRNPGLGTATNDESTRKCAGVKVSTSFASLERGQIGRELRIA